VVAAVDGRRGEVFVQTFNLDDDVTTLRDPTVSLTQDVVDEWTKSGDVVTFTGDGVIRYESLFSSVVTGTVLDQRVPPVREALRLGALRPAERQIVPLYLREADAVANFSTRERSA
jgi:tRNA A37 threonylcarbamoyladenosine modification protein TsaB